MCPRCEKLEGELLRMKGRTASGAYLTEEERLEARRATWRASQRRIRRDYFRLCKKYEQVPRGREWAKHLRELRTLDSPHEFWRSKFTQAEIDSMWAGVSLYLGEAA